MAGRACFAIVLALVAACGGDDDSGGGGGGDGVLLSGTACTTPIRFELAGDEKLTLFVDSSTQLLDGFMVADGPLFDTESQAAWATYAAANDVALLIAFDDPEPATAHVITAIFDSFFGGRDVGTLGFVEHMMGELVEIKAIDTGAKTIDLSFTIPVGAFTNTYPPDFDMLVECNAGTVTGGFTGKYETMSF